NGGHFIDDHCDNRSRSRPARSPSGATHCWIATAVVLRSRSTGSRLDRRGTTSPKLAPIRFAIPERRIAAPPKPLQLRLLCLSAPSASDCVGASTAASAPLGRRGSKPASMLAAPRPSPPLEDCDHLLL